MTADQVIILIASGMMIGAYWLIPRRPYHGWILSFVANAVELRPMWDLHRPDLMLLPFVFMVLALWNAIRERNKTRTK